MTKHFCDKCRVESLDKSGIKISFLGNVKGRLIVKNYHFCEGCYEEIENTINKIIPETVGENKI